MADLTFGIKGPTMDLNVAMAVSDTDAPRILAYLASIYGTDEEGSPRTLDKVAEAFAGGILKGLLNETVAFERNAAMKAAAEAVRDIDPL